MRRNRLFTWLSSVLHSKGARSTAVRGVWRRWARRAVALSWSVLARDRTHYVYLLTISYSHYIAQRNRPLLRALVLGDGKCVLNVFLLVRFHPYASEHCAVPSTIRPRLKKLISGDPSDVLLPSFYELGPASR